MMIPYEGRLALVTMLFPFDSVNLYILKNEDGHRWTHQSLLHVPFTSEWRDRISYKRVTDAGELVFPDHIESLFSM